MSYDDLRYDEVRQKSSHNAFQRREGLYDQIAYWRIRSLEADIHRKKPFCPAIARDWYVYHSPFDPDTTVERLSGFLQICAGIQRAVPRHEVITLFLDVKDSFHRTATASQSGAALDALLMDVLGEDHLYRPRDLLAHAPAATSLRDAVAHGWPTLRELRGRFLIVLTGSEEALATYSSSQAANRRVAFLSTRVSRASEVPGPPHIVFYNMDGQHVRVAKSVHRAGLVSRAYYVDSKARWQSARDQNCHHIATDKVNSRVDSWAKTRQPTGFPFDVLEDSTPSITEAGDVCGVWARSGDVWGTDDSFLFHFRDTAGAPDNRYQFYVSGPNSHVEDWIKGGVMARSSLAKNSPYLGVFRIGEHHGLRVQYRAAQGGPTMAEEKSIDADGIFDADTLVFVRLSITKGGRRAQAWGSIDGTKWTRLGVYEFPAPLRYQGIGVSSHDTGRGAKFLFGVPGTRPRPPFNRTRFVGRRTQQDQGWADWDELRRWRVDRFSS